MEYVNLYSACYTKPLPSQVPDVTPGLISQTSGLNQVHTVPGRRARVTAAKDVHVNPRSVAILTLNSGRLTASRHTQAKSDIPRLSVVSHASSGVCVPSPGTHCAGLTTTPPRSTELTIQP